MGGVGLPRAPLTDLSISAALPEDLPLLAELEARCRFEPWPLETFGTAMAHAGSIAVTARDAAGQPVAFAIGWAVAGELHLHDICVAPEFRGRGTGRRLLDAFLAAGHGEAVLEVRASNAPAIALYRSAGFVVAGCRMDYYDLPREDALVMVRPC